LTHDRNKIRNRLCNSVQTINHSELEYYEHMEVMCPSYCGRER